VAAAGPFFGGGGGPGKTTRLVRVRVKFEKKNLVNMELVVPREDDCECVCGRGGGVEGWRGRWGEGGVRPCLCACVLLLRMCRGLCLCLCLSFYDCVLSVSVPPSVSVTVSVSVSVSVSVFVSVSVPLSVSVGGGSEKRQMRNVTKK
jgi:hypothetical protein